MDLRAERPLPRPDVGGRSGAGGRDRLYRSRRCVTDVSGGRWPGVADVSRAGSVGAILPPGAGDNDLWRIVLGIRARYPSGLKSRNTVPSWTGAQCWMDAGMTARGGSHRIGRMRAVPAREDAAGDVTGSAFFGWAGI